MTWCGALRRLGVKLVMQALAARKASKEDLGEIRKLIETLERESRRG